MILDTTFVIDVLRGEPAAIRKLNELLAEGEAPVIAAPTVFELFSGLERLRKSAAERERIRRVLAQHAAWPLDERSAEAGGEVDGQLVARGLKIDPLDAMIAGIALTRHDAVLTRDVEHFRRVPGLHLETY